MATSVSDNGEYPAFCFAAAENDEVFQTFKQNETYILILEHTLYSQATFYLQDMLKKMGFKKKVEN